MAESDRPAKQARLTQMRRGLPYMSASAMSALLKDVKEHMAEKILGPPGLQQFNWQVGPLDL